MNIVTEPSNRWTSREISGNPSTENPNARFPRLTYGENKNNNRASTFWLADNRYLRFKNLTARYSYAHPWLSNVIGVSGIDISLLLIIYVHGMILSYGTRDRLVVMELNILFSVLIHCS